MRVPPGGVRGCIEVRIGRQREKRVVWIWVE